jgi:multiple sugar transport system substrate-binding protein
MTDSNPAKWSRRRVLATAASGVALAAATGLPMPAIAQSRKLTYWGGLIFSDDANKLLSDTITAWGAANGVETEVVMINQNETTQKVSAAVSSNTMPDAMDTGLGLLRLLGRQNVFSDVGELYKKIGDAQGGWFTGPDTATDLTADGGVARIGIQPQSRQCLADPGLVASEAPCRVDRIDELRAVAAGRVLAGGNQHRHGAVEGRTERLIDH